MNIIVLRRLWLITLCRVKNLSCMTRRFFAAASEKPPYQGIREVGRVLRTRRVVVFYRAISLLILGCSVYAATPFFPFCIDWHDTKKRGFEEQAAMLKELGYDGVGHIWLPKVAERIESLDAVGLKLFQITVAVNIAPQAKTPYDEQQFKDVLALIKGRHVQFCLLIGGFKPGDPAGEARGVEILRHMSDLARDSGAQLLIYPHVGNWTERIEFACTIAEKVDRPNVGVMFNLCHWLRADPSRDYRPLLQKALPRLWAVSINGADMHDDKPGWSHYIQPLDAGNFDMLAFLRTLKELGYSGPIGLQCFGIGGDTREHLARSIAAWHKLNAQLDAAAKK